MLSCSLRLSRSCYSRATRAVGAVGAVGATRAAKAARVARAVFGTAFGGSFWGQH